MAFETDGAFEKINAEVDKTLARAALMLKNMAKPSDVSSGSEGETTVSISQVHKVEYKSVAVTAASVGSPVSTHPKTTIRTPNDAKKKNHGLFPPAVIRSASELKTVLSDDVISDSIFSPANFIPNKEPDLPSQAVATAPRSFVRKAYERAALEPLADVKKIWRGGGRHKVPDSEFPLAGYDAGSKTPKVVYSPMQTTIPTSLIKTFPMSERSSMRSPVAHSSTASTDLTSLICEPMEFTSKDGRMKMFLQPADYRVAKNPKTSESLVAAKDALVDLKPPKEAPNAPKTPLKARDSSKSLEIPDYKDHQLDLGLFEEDFDSMRRFESTFDFNGMKMDVVGLFKGRNLRRSKIRKILINDDPYHPTS